MTASIRSKKVYQGTVSQSTHLIEYPATIVAGDTLLLLVASFDDGTTVTASGFTSRAQQNASTVFSMDILTKKATGSESGNLTIDLNASNENICAALYCLQDAADPDVDTPSIGTREFQSVGATVNAPNLDTGTSKDYLWIWFSMCDIGISATCTVPTNYTGEDTLNATTTKVTSMRTALRSLTAQSEDPGTADWSAACTSLTAVIAIHPGASGPSVTDVNTTESWTDGDTGLVATGTGFV